MNNNTMVAAVEMLARFGVLKTRTYLLSAEGSEAWGAYLPEGSDDDACRKFRSQIKTALRDVAAERGWSQVEICADGGPVNAQGWTLTVVEVD